MKNTTFVTIQDVELSVNKIFECQQKAVELHLTQTPKNSEEVLLEHLAKALQLLDRSTD